MNTWTDINSTDTQLHDRMTVWVYGSGHETEAVLLPGFAIDSKTR